MQRAVSSSSAVRPCSVRTTAQACPNAGTGCPPCCNMKCEPSPGLLPAGRVRKLRLEKLNPQDFPTSVLHVQCVGDGWGWLGCTFFIHTRGCHSCSFAMLGIMQGDAAFEKVRGLIIQHLTTTRKHALLIYLHVARDQAAKKCPLLVANMGAKLRLRLACLLLPTQWQVQLPAVAESLGSPVTSLSMLLS